MQVATQVWWFAAVRLSATVIVGLLVGWMFDNIWAGLALTLAIALGWQLAAIFRVHWWVRHRSHADPPDMGGIWGDVIGQIVRLHRRKRFHKQRYLQLLRQLQRSTAALPDGVVVVNAQREIVWFNTTSARLLGLRRGEDVGLRIDNLLRQPEFSLYLEIGDFSNAIVLQPSVGEDTYLSLQVVPYGDGQQLILVHDVSRQMRLEAMRKDFVANASHELRSPLTVISGYLETLSQDSALDADLQAPVSEMRRQADRMTAIIRDLLALSRLEETDEIGHGSLIDVTAITSMLKKDVLARASHPKDVKVRADSDVQLIGDEAEIHSALSNLVDNAAKYTPPEGSIDMRWWADADGGHFRVTDTGIGIPAEHLPRLTERFYRVDAGRSRATGGSGLGLAIVKHVLQRHGATLSIESTLGSGSTFAAHFPPHRVQRVRSQSSAAV
jgi:two-component system, OmpR family, phosphate regulon sensor histidine kinase PhoR